MALNPESTETDGNFVIDEVSAPDDVTEREQASVTKMMKSYKEARTFDENARKQYVVDRGYASGQKTKNWASDANLIGSFIDILTSFMYARDPDMTAKAAKQVGGSTEENATFAETAGIVTSKLWKKGRLKAAARKQVRSALTVGVGWLKVIMTHEMKRDPQVEAELNDLEDNMNRLQAEQQLVAENELEESELQAKLDDIERLQASLMERLEVVYRRGAAIDFVNADDMQVSLDVDDITEHLNADWNSNEMYVRMEDVRTDFPRITKDDLQKVTQYHQQKPKTREQEEEYAVNSPDREAARYVKSGEAGGEDCASYARVIEVWDKRDNHIKTMIEGVKKWAVEPYPPPYASSRFFPYFQFVLFEVDGARHPQSLSYRLMKLQNEYSSKRSNSRLVGERSIPGTIFDQTGLTVEDARKIETSVNMEMIGIKNVKGDDIRKLFAAKPVPTVDPMIFNTQPVLADMERISGVQEALTSGINTPKTATEAKIQDQGFNSRSSADRDTLEDMLDDLALYTTELAVQSLPPDYVERLAGPLAFWPYGMDVDDVVTLVELEIKAGTTGKPDEEADRQSWSVLLPLIQAIMQQVQQAQFMGNIPMADALVNLLKETMRRLDERIDVEQFIPQGLPNLAGVPQMPGADGRPENTPTEADAGPQTSAEANTLV